jgi:hypothetical protein
MCQRFSPISCNDSATLHPFVLILLRARSRDYASSANRPTVDVEYGSQRKGAVHAQWLGSAVPPSVFDLDLGIPDHRSPFVDFRLQEGGQFGCRRILGNRSEIAEPRSSGFLFLTRFLHANRYPLRSKTLIAARIFLGRPDPAWEQAHGLQPGRRWRGASPCP